MNYGKKSTEKKIKYANSNGKRYATKFFLGLGKTCLILVLFAGVILASTGYGMFRGIIDSAPEVNVDSIVPIGYATNVYNSVGQLTDTLVTAGSNRQEAAYEELPQCLIDAFVAIEDSRFWTHNGIDIRSIVNVIAVKPRKHPLPE